MNALELLASAAKREQGKFLVTLSDAQTAAQKSAMRYDREGDNHFDIASALMKSMRGSDPDAAVHYLARLLEAGDLITAIPVSYTHLCLGLLLTGRIVGIGLGTLLAMVGVGRVIALVNHWTKAGMCRLAGVA